MLLSDYYNKGKDGKGIPNSPNTNPALLFLLFFGHFYHDFGPQNLSLDGFLRFRTWFLGQSTPELTLVGCITGC